MPEKTIRVSRFDAGANGGAGGWTLLGGAPIDTPASDLGTLELLIVDGEVAAFWRDASTGSAVLKAAVFDGSGWGALGAGGLDAAGIGGIDVVSAEVAVATDGGAVTAAFCRRAPRRRPAGAPPTLGRRLERSRPAGRGRCIGSDSRRRRADARLRGRRPVPRLAAARRRIGLHRYHLPRAFHGGRMAAGCRRRARGRRPRRPADRRTHAGAGHCAGRYAPMSVGTTSFTRPTASARRSAPASGRPAGSSRLSASSSRRRARSASTACRTRRISPWTARGRPFVTVDAGVGRGAALLGTPSSPGRHRRRRRLGVATEHPRRRRLRPRRHPGRHGGRTRRRRPAGAGAQRPDADRRAGIGHRRRGADLRRRGHRSAKTWRSAAT